MATVKTSATEMLARTVKLSTGQTMPQIQLGLYMMTPSETTRSVHWALSAGYRAFDSAQWYHNESATATAIADFLASPTLNRAGLTRQDIHYTTKLRENSTSPAAVRASIEKSLKAVEKSLGYIDLFLLHSPLGGAEAREVSWRAVEDVVLSGKVRMAGVSNFGKGHVEELMRSEGGLRVRPVVNQIEVHPFNVQRGIREVCERYGIVVQAYAPLARGMRFGDRRLREVAGRYGCSEAQLMVRWSIQHGFVTLPKSAKRERLIENADVCGFEISKEDMEVLDGLDEHLVTDWDPTDAA